VREGINKFTGFVDHFLCLNKARNSKQGAVFLHQSDTFSAIETNVNCIIRFALHFFVMRIKLETIRKYLYHVIMFCNTA
jgi:hypothetical protein